MWNQEGSDEILVYQSTSLNWTINSRQCLSGWGRETSSERPQTAFLGFLFLLPPKNSLQHKLYGSKYSYLHFWPCFSDKSNSISTETSQILQKVKNKEGEMIIVPLTQGWTMTSITKAISFLPHPLPTQLNGCVNKRKKKKQTKTLPSAWILLLDFH